MPCEPSHKSLAISQSQDTLNSEADKFRRDAILEDRRFGGIILISQGGIRQEAFGIGQAGYYWKETIGEWKS